MHEQPTIERLNGGLLTARKVRDRVKVAALQGVLARISNAEAIPVNDSKPTYQMHIGVGSSEATRHILSEEDIQHIIQDEINELQDAMQGMAEHTEHPYRTELKQKVDILAAYLKSS
jgi:hypothetical protein